MKDPEIVYDAETDTLMISVSEARNRGSYEPVPGVIVTVDEEGDVTTLEFMGPNRKWFAPLIDHFLAEAQPEQTRKAG